MFRFRSRWVSAFAAALAMVVAGCSSPAPPISVTLSPSSPQAIDSGQTTAITATVPTGASVQGVTWSLTGPGVLSSVMGLSVTYNPPAGPLTSSLQATVKATSVADPTKSASLQITVNALPQISFQNLPNGLVGASYSQPIAFTGGTSPFQWMSDGKLDLAMTDADGNAVIILLGNGDGTFGAPTTIPVGNQPASIIAGDFNNDGKLDLAIANSADHTITLLLGNGDGTFTAASASPYPTGVGPFQVVAADFNNDGKLDLAVANQDGTITILLQS